MNVPPDPAAAPVDPHDGDLPDEVRDLEPAPTAEEAAETRVRERRQRLAEEIVAGMLPGTTSDERPDGSGASGYSEQWYRENRPPHHG